MVPTPLSPSLHKHLLPASPASQHCTTFTWELIWSSIFIEFTFTLRKGETGKETAKDRQCLISEYFQHFPGVERYDEVVRMVVGDGNKVSNSNLIVASLLPCVNNQTWLIDWIKIKLFRQLSIMYLSIRQPFKFRFSYVAGCRPWHFHWSHSARQFCVHFLATQCSTLLSRWWVTQQSAEFRY